MQLAGRMGQCPERAASVCMWSDPGSCACAGFNIISGVLLTCLAASSVVPVGQVGGSLRGPAPAVQDQDQDGVQLCGRHGGGMTAHRDDVSKWITQQLSGCVVELGAASSHEVRCGSRC